MEDILEFLFAIFVAIPVLVICGLLLWLAFVFGLGLLVVWFPFYAIYYVVKNWKTIVKYTGGKNNAV
jgi:hypothetical protein